MATHDLNLASTRKSTTNNLLRFPRVATQARTTGSNKMAVVIPFPKQGECPTCGKPANENELSSCTTCSKKFCDDKDCDWSCSCSRIADFVEQRVMRRLDIGRTP
jgi:hypothetical protein